MRCSHGITDLMDMSLGNPLGVGDRQGGLACCNSWVCNESDMTERLKRTKLNPTYKLLLLLISWDAFNMK